MGWLHYIMGIMGYAFPGNIPDTNRTKYFNKYRSLSFKSISSHVLYLKKGSWRLGNWGSIILFSVRRHFLFPGNKFTFFKCDDLRSLSNWDTLISVWCNKVPSSLLLLMTAKDSAFFDDHNFPKNLPGFFQTQQPAVHTARGVTSLTFPGKFSLR